VVKDFDMQETALLTLGEMLRDAGYRFITPTPATHAVVNARGQDRRAMSLTDVFGWSRPFAKETLPTDIFNRGVEAGVMERHEESWRSAVRFSSLGSHLFVHSAFPTNTGDAVFFGPDTYRFARLLATASHDWHLPAHIRIVDIGCGSGAGGIYLSRLLEPRADVELILADVNRRALRFARVNAALNSCHARVVESDVLNAVDGTLDIVVANPPYLVDDALRVYRHGGGAFGEALGVRIVEESLARLKPGGRLVLYTGSAIVDGRDSFFACVKPILARSNRTFSYEEIDPDVFGEELLTEPYTRADRIAVVGLCVG
jgi:methylase of polypeptide subunit release factors